MSNDDERLDVTFHWSPERFREVMMDENRWRLVEEALDTPDLKTDLARLSAIGAIVQSRKPLTAADIARTQALAEQFGWARGTDAGNSQQRRG